MQERPDCAQTFMEETNLVPQSVPSPAPAPDPSPVPSPPSSGYSPPSGSTPSGDQGFTSIRDYVSGLGLTDLASQHQDDEGVVNFLVQQHRNAQQAAHLTPYAQRYLQHAQAFEEFLSQRSQQQQSQAQAQTQQKRFWSPPEYNPSWARFVTRDEAGNLALSPGASPDILPKVAAYDQYVRDFVHRFTNNPSDTLAPLIQEVVQPLLEQHLQSYMGSFQERTAAREFISGNNGWLYQSSPNGGTLRDGNGNLVLSENGQLFANLVYEAEQMGMDTVAKQQRYAARVLSAAGRYGVAGGVASNQQQPAASVNDQLKQQFLHRPNPAGAIGLSSPSPQPTQSDVQLSLADILRRNLASGGINDAALAADIR